MPWTTWLIVALVFLTLDTIIRYVRFRHDPKAWTLVAAVTGAVVWSVAWFVLTSALRYSMMVALVQIALFAALYIAIVLLLGTRFFARR